MEVTGKKGIGDLLSKFLEVCFVVGIVILLGLPFWLQSLGLNLGAASFIIYPNGIALLVIVKIFIKLFKSLKNNNPFCNQNVKLFKYAGIVSLIESGLWLLDLLYEMILAKTGDIVIILILAFLVILFFGVFIALYILSELFKQATKYKEENELTI